MTEYSGTGHAGFTLLEIMVAVFIFAIVMTTVFSSFGSFITTGQSITGSVALQENLRCPMAVMETDIQSVVVSQPPKYKKPRSGLDPDPFRLEGDVVSVNGQSFSTLMFASLNHIPIGGKPVAGVARIRYHVRPNPESGFDLCRSDFLRPFPPDPSQGCDPVLFRNVLEFSLTFLDDTGKESTHWDSESRETDYTFPAFIDILIRQKTGAGQETIRTRFPVNVARQVGED